jgi:hypothetical protein
LVGVDSSPYCAALLKPEVRFLLCDVSADQEYLPDADLAICMETLEHLPEAVETQVMDRICKLAKRHILFSAAAPGQPGCGHVNLKPRDHWAKHLESRGFEIAEATMALWKQEWTAAGVVDYLVNNAVLGTRPAARPASPPKARKKRRTT